MEVFQSIAEQAENIAVVLTICFYLLQCFFGYKFLKMSCSLIGFILGFIIGFIVSIGPLGLTGYVPAIVGVIAGTAAAFAAFKIYLAGVFVLAGVLAAAASWMLPIPQTGPWNTVKIVVLIAAFVIAGVLAVKYSKPCIIIITAVGGAFAASGHIRDISVYVSANQYLYWGLIAVLAAAGLLVQFLSTKNE